jgi:hypothetical protein
MQKFKSKLSAPVPDDWFAKDSYTLLSPDGQANIIMSSEPLDPSIDTEAYAHVQGDLLRKEFPGYREFIFEPTQIFGGRSGWLRRFEWKPPDGEPVVQIQLYYAENGRGYTATATTRAIDIKRFELDLRLVLGGLRIEP